MRTAPDARIQLLSGALALAALALPTVLVPIVDPRLLHALSVWDKPLKFDLSLGLHMLTLAVLLKLLWSGVASAAATASARRAAIVVTTCGLLEALYITLQAARGRASHYNRETPLETFLYYGAMGPGAVAILVGTFWIGWLLYRHTDLRTPGLRRGAALGLMLGSALTMVVVVPLSAGMVDGLGHWVGGPHTDAYGLAVTGWATRGGDLRVPHFFATHLAQVLPLVGWAADRVVPQRAITWVHAAAGIGTAVVAFTFWQALTGRAFLAG